MPVPKALSWREFDPALALKDIPDEFVWELQDKTKVAIQQAIQAEILGAVASYITEDSEGEDPILSLARDGDDIMVIFVPAAPLNHLSVVVPLKELLEEGITHMLEDKGEDGRAPLLLKKILKETIKALSWDGQDP